MKNFLIKRLLSLSTLLCFLLILGCADQRLVYRNLAFNLKLRYPPTWEKQEYQGETLVMFLIPSQEDEVLTKNVNIAVQDLDRNINLEMYTQGVLRTIRMIEQVPGAYVSILSQQQRQIRRQQGHQIVYTVTQYGLPQEAIDAGLTDETDGKGQSFQILQLWTIYNQRAYIVTYLAPKDTFDYAKDDVDSMIKSIEFF